MAYDPNEYTQKLMQDYDPMRRQQAANINQQYNQAGRTATQSMANNGLRGDTAGKNYLALQIARNNALGANDANYQQMAVTNALPAAQFDEQQRTNQANLTGMYNGNQQTLASRLADRDEAYRQQQLAQQQNQWQQQFNQQSGMNTFNQDQQSYANKLALWQALANYNKDIGSLTGAYPVVNNLNQGDFLVSLLQQLGR